MPPLTVPIRPPEAFLEKTAASPIGNVPDDVEKWPAHVLSELQRVFPFLGRHDVSINIDKVDPEVGYGAGYAMVRNFSARTVPQADVVALRNYVRIPIVIQERKLLRPKSFELGGEFYALNKQRLGQAMSTTQIFEGAETPSRLNTSLFDNMFPEYHQRNGTGRIYDGKMASAQDMLDVAAAAREKIAAFRAFMGGPYFGDREWLEQFYSTPFFEEAQALFVKDAQGGVEDAKRRAALAVDGIARARLDVEGAELSAKLASFMFSSRGVPENETLSKLSSSSYKGDAWIGEFSGTPYHEDALIYRAKVAQEALKDVLREDEDQETRRYRERNVGAKALEAKLAAWKYEQVTGREFPAEKEASGIQSALVGGAAGFAAGRRLAGAVSGGVAPHGTKGRTETVARALAVPTSALGAAAGYVHGKKHQGAFMRLANKHTDHGLSRDDQAFLRESLYPAGTAFLGGAAAGALTGLAAGGAARLKSRFGRTTEKGGSLPDKEAALPPALARAGIGAGVGALGGAAVAGKGGRKKGMLRGAMLGAGAGAASSVPAVAQAAQSASAPLRAAAAPHVQAAKARAAPVVAKLKGVMGGGR